MSETAAKLEDFLANKPLNDRMRRLMNGEDDADQGEKSAAPVARNYADGTPITNQDRDQLRRLLIAAGWQVLLKLLDTSLQQQEDAAKQISLLRAVPDSQKLEAWNAVAANRAARNTIVALAEAEVAKLKAAKKTNGKAS